MKSQAPLYSAMQISSSVGDLWRHRELLWQFTVRSIEVRHKGSHLGLIWSVLNPLLMLSLYVFIFGYVFGGKFGVLPKETPIDFALGMLIGLAIFQLLAEVIGISPLTIVMQPNFVKKVVFPLEVLPVANVGASVFHFLISLTLVALGIALLGSGLTWSSLWLPIIVFPVVLLSIGLAWLISSLGVFFRDIGQVTQFLTQVLMFASAVFYPPSKLPRVAWQFLRFNPVLLAIEQARSVVLWHQPLNLHHLGFLYLSGLAVFGLGHTVFSRLKPAFADVL
jgi:lipopolysaccharide transport system permease protein